MSVIALCFAQWCIFHIIIRSKRPIYVWQNTNTHLLILYKIPLLNFELGNSERIENWLAHKHNIYIVCSIFVANLFCVHTQHGFLHTLKMGSIQISITFSLSLSPSFLLVDILVCWQWSESKNWFLVEWKTWLKWSVHSVLIGIGICLKIYKQIKQAYLKRRAFILLSLSLSLFHFLCHSFAYCFFN